MSEHYHEHHDALLAWTWKLFCVKWGRTLVYAAREQVRRDAQDIRREMDKLGG